MLNINIKARFIFFTTVLLLNSCTSLNGWVGTKLGLDTDLSITLKVDSDINPDDKKKPSPLFIRLYELKSPKMFDRADFIGLYERDKEVLGADFIAKQELKRIIPGEGREDHFVLNKDTQYIALFAEFLDYRTSKYKVITSIVANNVVSTSIVIQISSNKIILLNGSGESIEIDSEADQ